MFQTDFPYSKYRIYKYNRTHHLGAFFFFKNLLDQWLKDQAPKYITSNSTFHTVVNHNNYLFLNAFITLNTIFFKTELFLLIARRVISQTFIGMY